MGRSRWRSPSIVRMFPGPRDLEHRCLGGDRDRFLNGADRHHRIHTDVRAGPDQNAFLAVGGEAGKRRLNDVIAHRQVEQPVGALAVGDRGGGADERRAHGGDRDSGKHGARVVGDRAADAGVAGLSEREGRKDEGRRKKQRESGLPHGSSSMRCLGFQGCGPTAPVPR